MSLTDPLPVVALVAAAGSGSRLGGGVPKALRLLDGVAMVRRSADRLVAGGVEHLVVSVPKGRAAEVLGLLDGVGVPVSCVVGGAERQESVRLGLAACAEAAGGDAVVLVHDAARPLVPAEMVARVIAAVRAGERSVVPALPVVDSIRRTTPTGSQVVDRSTLVGVQTPQGFDLATLVAAHQHVAEQGLQVTDDAACCEAIGVGVHLVEGSRWAMKVTEPLDLLVAEGLLASS